MPTITAFSQYCARGPGQCSSVRKKKTAKRTVKEGTKLTFLDDMMVYQENSKTIWRHC